MYSLDDFSKLRAPFVISLLLLNSCSHTALPNKIGPTINLPVEIDTGLDTINAFDVYVDQDKIHLIVAGGSLKNPKLNPVHYLHTQLDGRQWSKAVEIGQQLPATIATRGNDIQLAVAGNQLLAVWQTQGELPNMGPLVSVYSTDAGQTWAVGSNPAANPMGDQAHLDLVADDQDHFHVVWLEDPEENGYQSLRYANSQDTGQHWNTAKTLDDSTCSCCWNIVKMSPQHTLNLLYRNMEPRDMALLQSANYGQTWLPSTVVGQFNWQFDGCPHIGGALAFSEDTLHSLAWTGAEQFRGLYYLRSENQGKTWTPPQRLGNKALHGDIAAINQQVTAVWDEMEPEGTRIFKAQSLDNGATWSTPTALSPVNSLATHPRLVATYTGYLALWTEKSAKQGSRLRLAVFK